MLPAPIEVSVADARRFMRRAVLLETPVASVAEALAHHGYIQIDPINVCGRMHDLIARNRIAGYREGDLMRYLHGAGETPLPAEQRVAFEHHLPPKGILVAFELEAWPYLLAAMRARTKRAGAWSGRLSKREREMADHVLAEIATRGALNSDSIEDDRRAWRSVWGSASLAKATLQKLFFHGRLLISRREGSRRFYDLRERVLPARVLALPEPSKKEVARWEVRLGLRQRRLVTLRRVDVPLVTDIVQPVKIPGCPLLYCLRSDVPLLEQAIAESGSGRPDGIRKMDMTGTGDAAEVAEAIAEGGAALPVHLLAPLDPLIYDRVVTSKLWGFDYTWEVYTPPQKRVRGYYALPLLSGHELVGHIDPKADREARRLRVMARRVQRGHSATDAVKRLAEFLGLKAR